MAVSLLVPVLLAIFAASSPTEKAGSACSSLQLTLGASVVKTSGLQYDATASGAWNLFNDGYKPGCIIYPTSAAHVQSAMAAIYSFGASFSVQSGGHSAMKGWNKCVSSTGTIPQLTDF